MVHPMLNIAIQAARAASKIIIRHIDQLDKLEITEKAHNDFVTQVDKQSEAIIIETIRKAYPAHCILAEESGQYDGNQNDFCWIIDPLDGTKNFLHGYPHFCISIALARKNITECALIYDPIRQDLFTATRGQGSYLNSRRIRVSDVKKMSGALIGTGFPYHHDAALSKSHLSIFETIFSTASSVRRGGAAALDLAYVASGKLDGFWEAGLQPWDIAAGALLVKEAGGAITDFSGSDFYLKNGNIVSGNMKIQKELLRIIDGSIK